MTPTLVAFLIPLGSLHFPYTDQNQFNPGLAAEVRLEGLPESISFAGGSYYNSWRRTTVFAQVVWTPVRAGDFRAGASFGPATGYNVPAVGGMFVSYGHVHLTFVPPTGGDRAAMVAVALRIPVGH